MSKVRFLRHKFPLARRILKFLFQGVTLSVRRGSLRGRRWSVTTNAKFFQGTYEPAQTCIFRELVKEGTVVYDVGAHIGYYSVLASSVVRDSGHVVSFEPLPYNLRYLRRHLEINGCDNVTVIDACVAEHSGVCRFDRAKGIGTATGHISENGELAVQMVSLDELLNEGAIPPPDYIKIDAEGAEHSILQGAQSLLTRIHPTIFLSLHGEHIRKQCFEFLTAHGYQLRPIGEDSLAEAGEILATVNE